MLKDGDVIHYEINHSLVDSHHWIGILEGKLSESIVPSTTTAHVDYYCSLGDTGCFITSFKYDCAENIRLATDEEKKQLFDAIESNGYQWDAENKRLERQSDFEPGDVAYVRYDNGDEYIFIYETIVNDKVYSYLHLKNGRSVIVTNCMCDCDSKDIRHATEAEKQKLFDALDAKGYRWNPESRTLESKGSDTAKFDISTLKPFDQVLVRNGIISEDKWKIQFFEKFNKVCEYPFICMGSMYKQCIPYKGNEHLLDSKDNCDDFYKIWE